ncbi:MAG: hypothetical protein KDE19_01365, partial [Caldilineaceae bacterium]|nr:hypothetical protein [Caldilineaceae bacterium]
MRNLSTPYASIPYSTPYFFTPSPDLASPVAICYSFSMQTSSFGASQVPQPPTSPPTSARPRETLRGVVERITYHNEETGYTVAKLTPERRTGTGFGRDYQVAVVGTMLGVNVGESVELTGQWTIHAEYGKQFSVEQMRAILPATVAGIEKYLGSGLIRGVGPVTAKRIVKHFGVETLEIIETTPARLNEVPG